MKALIETRTKGPERVFLVGIELKSRRASELRDSLVELAELASTAGGEVVGEGVQKLEAPHAGTFIGKGKADEFAEYCRRNDVDSPAAINFMKRYVADLEYDNLFIFDEVGWNFEPSELSAAFGLVQHNFFVLFNALVGLLFLPRARRELFG